MAYDLNMSWSPTGRIIIKNTADPRVFIIRFSNAGDFSSAIYSIPNRVQGKLLTMHHWSGDTKIKDIDFNTQDYWIKFDLRSDLVERGYVAEIVAEKVGRVLNLLGPLNSNGEYKAHVLVDITKALVHQIKIIIIEGNDRETIKMKIFFLEIPHGTCRDCWFVDADHSEEKCRARYNDYKINFPKIFVYGEEENRTVEIGNTSQDAAQGNENVAKITNVAAGLRIYDSEIDRVDYLNRGSKRRRINIEENTEESCGGNDVTYLNSVNHEKGKAVGIIGDRREITTDDLKKAL
ncbi:hypothetical protein MKW98_014185 [Papaver atlanticum]|uniref:DUF4283 domain-containing protein n=1 Tax=Papaver atlanticum TaxID=357466 RepID=A0AAD4SKF6_9MAGN|nr:hypothetical protein MKW98_014185 [Papaver atlanticum]